MNFVRSEQQHADNPTKDLAVIPFDTHAEFLMNSSASTFAMTIKTLPK